MKDKKLTIKIPYKIETHIKVNQGIIFTQAKLNGKLKSFIIDSGAPSIILNAKHIDSPYLSKQNEFQGISGKGYFSKFLIKEFNWNKLIIKNELVNVIDLSHLESELKEPIYGLIGYNQLSYFTFHIDYINRKIKLWRNFKKQNAIIKEIPFILQNHIPIIETAVGGKKLKFGLDTGAGKNALNIKHKPIFNNNFITRKNDMLKGADKSEQTVEYGLINSLVFNTIGFRKMKTVFSNLDHLSMVFGELDGLLGYEFLKKKKMAISMTDKKIYILK